VLDEAASFKDGDLRQVISHMHAHEVPAQRTTIALLAPSPRDEFGVDFLWASIIAVVSTALRRSPRASV
jgi:hypothetical protein